MTVRPTSSGVPRARLRHRVAMRWLRGSGRPASVSPRSLPHRGWGRRRRPSRCVRDCGVDEADCAGLPNHAHAADGDFAVAPKKGRAQEAIFGISAMDCEHRSHRGFQHGGVGALGGGGEQQDGEESASQGGRAWISSGYDLAVSVAWVGLRCPRQRSSLGGGGAGGSPRPCGLTPKISERRG